MSIRVLCDLESLVYAEGETVVALPGREHCIPDLVASGALVAIIGNLSGGLWKKIAQAKESQENPYPSAYQLAEQLRKTVEELHLGAVELAKVCFRFALSDWRAIKSLKKLPSSIHDGILTEDMAYQEMLLLASQVQLELYQLLPQTMRVILSVEPGWRLPRMGMILSQLESWRRESQGPTYFFVGDKNRPNTEIGLVIPQYQGAAEFEQWINKICQRAAAQTAA